MARAHLGAVGAITAASFTALTTHAALDCLQRVGWMDGDYETHAHGSPSVIVAFGLMGLALVVFLYVLHVLDAGGRALPSLARVLRRDLGWRAVVAIAVLSCALLMAMEVVEQGAAGHFDGTWSAFGVTPQVPLLLILAIDIVVVVWLRGLCTWLTRAHARIVHTLCTLLRMCCASVMRPTCEPQAAFAASRCTVDAAHTHGNRAPPFVLAG